MKILLTIFVLFFSSSVVAEWIYFSTNEYGYDYCYDDQTIKKNNDHIFFWRLSDYNKIDKFGDMSVITYHKLDCSNFRYVWLNSKYYDQPMGEGKLNADENYEDWRYPKPGSIGYSIMNHICIKYNN